jgi:hypothetical protein
LKPTAEKDMEAEKILHSAISSYNEQSDDQKATSNDKILLEVRCVLCNRRGNTWKQKKICPHAISSCNDQPDDQEAINNDKKNLEVRCVL